MSLLIPRPAPDLTAPIVFLDIDGVLNHLNVYDKREPYINRDNMNCLNVLLDETKANLVISSAWRYLITNELMTIAGFHHMLVTHGLDWQRHVIGRTAGDEGAHGSDRFSQICAWLDENYQDNRPPWVAVDDTVMPDCPGRHAVYTESRHGLKSDQVSEAVAKLRRQGT